MPVLEIRNHGPLIVQTNYWDLPPRRGEVCMVSLNAGAFRLLLRPEADPTITDMRTAKECVVSRGPWPAAGLADAFEVLFDDRTADPFALHLAAESFDRLPTDDDAGKEWVLSVWTRPRRNGPPRKALERPCWYRLSARLPDLRPRSEP